VQPVTTSPHPLAEVLAAQERSARWLAGKTGKSPSYVTLVIQSKRRPSADFRARAADTLHVPESLLFPADTAA
jgi:transcriptional regulator with XRE-family HTH domain